MSMIPVLLSCLVIFASADQKISELKLQSESANIWDKHFQTGINQTYVGIKLDSVPGSKQNNSFTSLSEILSRVVKDTHFLANFKDIADLHNTYTEEFGSNPYDIYSVEFKQLSLLISENYHVPHEQIEFSSDLVSGYQPDDTSRPSSDVLNGLQTAVYPRYTVVSNDQSEAATIINLDLSPVPSVNYPHYQTQVFPSYQPDRASNIPSVYPESSIIYPHYLTQVFPGYQPDRASNIHTVYPEPSINYPHYLTQVFPSYQPDRASNIPSVYPEPSINYPRYQPDRASNIHTVYPESSIIYPHYLTQVFPSYQPDRASDIPSVYPEPSINYPHYLTQVFPSYQPDRAANIHTVYPEPSINYPQYQTQVLHSYQPDRASNIHTVYPEPSINYPQYQTQVLHSDLPDTATNIGSTLYPEP